MTRVDIAVRRRHKGAPPATTRRDDVRTPVISRSHIRNFDRYDVGGEKMSAQRDTMGVHERLLDDPLERMGLLPGADVQLGLIDAGTR